MGRQQMTDSEKATIAVLIIGLVVVVNIIAYILYDHRINLVVSLVGIVALIALFVKLWYDDKNRYEL